MNTKMKNSLVFGINLAMIVVLTLAAVLVSTMQTEYGFTKNAVVGALFLTEGLLIYNIIHTARKEYEVAPSAQAAVQSDMESPGFAYLADQLRGLQNAVGGLSEKMRAVSAPAIQPSTQPAAQQTPNGNDENEYKSRYETMKKIRDALPAKLAEGYCIYAVNRMAIDTRHSRWQVVGQYGTELFSCEIIRPITQNYEELQAVLFQTQYQAIPSLSMEKELYWD